MTGRGDLTDAEWARLEPLLPVSNGRCGRWRDHQQVINGVLHRVRTGVQWRDLPERFGAINKLKGFRAVATCYDKRGHVFLGAVALAAIVIWLRS
ncbi:transposase [Kitasatospora sp. NPDC050463]|uniref:transposase n=1 Tax=Kitasatospora sp. NPDC050463 TaxID=3155786 RepID=UPI0033E640F1